MEPVNFGISMKNIPIPAHKAYLLALLLSIEKFIHRVRWKTFHFLNPNSSNQKETYGFNSMKASPKLIELKALESGLYDIVKNVKFRPFSDDFQNKIKEHQDKIQNEDRIFVAADKTENFYLLEPREYKNLQEKNIQKEYRKSKDRLKNINLQDKNIAVKLNLHDRIHSISLRESFVTIKDHKQNFQNTGACRLLNPTKTEIGKISKQILEKVNSVVRDKSGLQQWKNTKSTLDWFINLQQKQSLNFIQFDIKDFYPSINEDLLLNAINFARQFIDISDEQQNIIFSCRRSILVHSGDTWEKVINKNFDVTQGSYDGAEVCELVGLFLLSQLVHLNVNVGLYRDDGLAVVKLTNRQSEQLKQQLHDIFDQFGLTILIEPNKKIVDFLDVTLDLKHCEYRPYIKPNNKPLYVHVKSNHPPSILKNIPSSIQKRLSVNSSNEQIFNNAIPIYQEALEESGYDFQLKYEPTINLNQPKRNRKRKIIYFNPPFSKEVATNIGQKFFKLLDECFPKDNKLNKILNRNTVKLSYSCTKNLQHTVSSHNAKIYKEKFPIDVQSDCKCGQNPCILTDGCDSKNIIYQATLTQDNGKVDTYVGLCSTPFWQRYANHKTSFSNQKHRNETTLSSFIWDLKEKNINFTLKWRVIDRGKPYNPVSGDCQLCLKEKFIIIFKPEISTLNSRNELGSNCRHKPHSLLMRVK